MTEYERILSNMESTYKEKTGCEPDEASDIGIRLKLLALELSKIGEQIETAKREAFPQTASGNYLSMHAEQRGLKRKESSFARGKLIFKRDSPAKANIVIPIGTLVAAEGGLEFETTEEGVLKLGETQVLVSGKCSQRGKRGNAAANTVKTLISPVNGILSVGNENFSGGMEEETDEELRKRLLRSFSSAPNGTNCAFYRKLALETPGVSFAKIIPRKNGVGTVHTILSGKDKSVKLSQEIVGEFLKKAKELKEINVDITAESANLSPKNIRAEISIESGANFSLEKELAMERVKSYIDEIEIGEKLYVSGIINALMKSSAVKNAVVLEPTCDEVATTNELISLGTLLINEMAVV